MTSRLNQDKIKITYTVLHDEPITEEEIKLSDNCSKSWSSLMTKVFSNKYLDILNKVTSFRSIVPSRVNRFRVEDMTGILSESNIIGIVDLISSSFLFNRSPMDLQLFILAGLGLSKDSMKKIVNNY